MPTHAPAEERVEFQNFVHPGVGRDLPLFGYDLFQDPVTTFAPLEAVPVTADYVIGPGDEIYIRAWGQVDIDYRTTVDRDGRIYVPKVGSISVAGIKFANLDERIRAAVRRVFKNFDLTATLGQLRSIQIFVVGNVVLRFDDGQVVALKSLSRFTIESYSYDAKSPGAGRIILSLLSGGMRAITGLVANTNHSNFALKTPVATIGIRGTDFLTVLSQGLYNKINAGSIGVTSSQGTRVFAAPQYVFTASPAVLPATVAPSAVPAGIFTELEAIVITGAAGGASAGAGLGLSPGTALGVGAAIAIGVGAAAAAASGDEDTVTPSSHH